MMRLRRPSFETWLTCTFVLIGLAWGAFLGARQIAGTGSALDRLENLTLDWRFSLAGGRSAPRGVVIAAIDDETIREAGGYPLPRRSVAKIVRELAARDAQAIAIDLLFVDAGHPEGDLELADALRATKSVVAAVGLFERDGSTREGPGSEELTPVPRPTSILWPIAAVRDATRTGLVNLSTDHAGVPRYVPMLFRAADGVVPSFALAASSSALSTEPVLGAGTLKLAARTVRMDFGYHLPIRYYGPRGSIRQFSATRALRGDLDADEVRGQLVLLGATAVGLGDKFATPFDNLVPGVEIFATAITNLLAGDGLTKTIRIRMIDAAAAMLLPVAMVLLLATRRPAVAVALAGAVFALWLAVTVAVFFSGYWLGIAVPLAAAAPVAGAFSLARFVHAQRAARRLTEETATLKKFQSPRLVEHVLAHPRFLERPVHQDVAVVFVDLSNFTGLAEAIGPEWARNLLSEFQALI